MTDQSVTTHINDKNKAVITLKHPTDRPSSFSYQIVHVELSIICITNGKSIENPI